MKSQPHGGAIRKQPNGRYELDGQDLTSGDCVMLLQEGSMGKKIFPKKDGVAVSMTARAWLHGRIEHGEDGYYFLWENTDPSMPGMKINLIDGMQMKRRSS